MTPSEANLALVRRYLQAIEEEAPPEALAAFFTEDVVQREHPNRLVALGATRGLAELLAGNQKGQRVLGQQRYEVRNALAQGDRVALEVAWSAVLKVPLGQLAPGDTLRAAFGTFLTLREGRICAQANYDCFDPF